jgi:DUF177 domain-containing protein
MKIRLHEIGDEPYTWSEEESVSLSALGREEVTGLSPVRWQGQIRRLDSGFLMRAGLAYEQTLACQRCLGSVTEPVEDEIELLLVRHERGADEEERELEDEDLGVMVIDGDEVDLRPLLVEQMQLNVPMRPLCREECAGLCPSCGADLNRIEGGDCGCERETVDPRWAGLADLRNRLSGERHE